MVAAAIYGVMCLLYVGMAGAQPPVGRSPGQTTLQRQIQRQVILAQQDGIEDSVQPNPYQIPRAESQHSEQNLILAAELDVGVPQIAGMNIVFEPWNFLQLRVGAISNFALAGLSAGATLGVPIDSALRLIGLSVQGGHMFEGSPDFLVSYLFQEVGFQSARLRSISYNYVNSTLALELGNERFRFSIRTGVLWLQMHMRGLRELFNINPEDTSLTVSDQGTVQIWAPTGQLSLAVFFY